MTKWFCFYQKQEKENKWTAALSDSRDKIIREIQPQLITVLDVDNSFDDDILPEDKFKFHYRGPFYMDFDSDDVSKSIKHFNEMLDKLEAPEDQDGFGLDLQQLELYATGGRGFHILFHHKLFHAGQPPARGTPMLPMIYKEMAYQMIVETLDLNIYSCGRGRQFRVANVKRANGRYKVPLTVAEARAMTPELYEKLCAEPRFIQTPEKAPQYNDRLGYLYASCETKTSDSIKTLKSKKSDTKLLEKFKGKVPTTLATVMKGEKLAENAGFHKIAMQLAIAAVAMGITLAEFLEQCEGLIASYDRGDSQRYNTPQKRREFLSQMYYYMDSNPNYSFKIGGIVSIMEKGVDVSDLDSGGEVEPSDEPEEEGIPNSITKGLRITPSGIFRKTEDGMQKVSELGMENPSQLLDIITGAVHGYEVDVYVNGEQKKRSVITMDQFSSRTKFLTFSMPAGGCNIDLPDTQIGAVADIMRHRTDKSGQKVYIVQREGLDVIATPGGGYDVIWADQYGVESLQGIPYRLTGSFTSQPQYKTDLRYAPDLVDTPETREFFIRLFNINSKAVVAKFFGFFVSCFISQHIRFLFREYPFLQVWGQAGSGKSQTTKLFCQMHYYQVAPRFTSAIDSTKFTLEEMMTASASIPFVLEEFKPREMHKTVLQKATNMMRTNYNNDDISKGAVERSTGASELKLTNNSNKAPMVVLSESQYIQSAAEERYIGVAMSKGGKQGKRDDFEHCSDHRTILSSYGRLCMEAARGVPMEDIRRLVRGYTKQIRQELGDRADDSDRVIHNLAVLFTGLEFGRRVMALVFGTTFDAVFGELRASVRDNLEASVPKVMSEICKVLSAIAHLSRYGDDERYKVVPGEDYVKASGAVFIRSKNCFQKYQRNSRILGNELLFDNYETFRSALLSYAGVLDSKCIGNPLKDSPNTDVFMLDENKLTFDEVEKFR